MCTYSDTAHLVMCGFISKSKKAHIRSLTSVLLSITLETASGTGIIRSLNYNNNHTHGTTLDKYNDYKQIFQTKKVSPKNA